MRFSLFALLSFLPVAILSAPATSWSGPGPTFINDTIFAAPADYTSPGVLYARTVELEGGVILATWENYSPEPPLVYYPIYKSVDGGMTWTHISNVTDQVNDWGMRYQPFMYELPAPIGDYPAGTILLAGNSIPTNLSNTQIDMYASRDKGYTWHFVSHIAAGGEAVPDNGLTPVWEPFIMIYEGQIVVYYSDQRDPAYGQKLVHQVSCDLKTWDAPVDDVAYSTYTDRPGMTTVTQLPNGKYMMTYEFGGGPGFVDYSFPVYYRINRNPLDFNSSVGYPIIAPDETQPQSSPYITWSPVGGPNGTILVSCGTLSPVFYNQALGDVNSWKAADTGVGIAYTRHLRVLKSNVDHLLIAGAGALPPSTGNVVTVSVLDIMKTIGS